MFWYVWATSFNKVWFRVANQGGILNIQPPSTPFAKSTWSFSPVYWQQPTEPAWKSFIHNSRLACTNQLRAAVIHTYDVVHFHCTFCNKYSVNTPMCGQKGLDKHTPPGRAHENNMWDVCIVCTACSFTHSCYIHVVLVLNLQPDPLSHNHNYYSSLVAGIKR